MAILLGLALVIPVGGGPVVYFYIRLRRAGIRLRLVRLTVLEIILFAFGWFLGAVQTAFPGDEFAEALLDPHHVVIALAFMLFVTMIIFGILEAAQPRSKFNCALRRLLVEASEPE